MLRGGGSTAIPPPPFLYFYASHNNDYTTHAFLLAIHSKKERPLSCTDGIPDAVFVCLRRPEDLSEGLRKVFVWLNLAQKRGICEDSKTFLRFHTS